MSSSNKKELELQDQASDRKDKDLHSEENLLQEKHPSKDQIHDADEEKFTLWPKRHFNF